MASRDCLGGLRRRLAASGKNGPHGWRAHGPPPTRYLSRSVRPLARVPPLPPPRDLRACRCPPIRPPPAPLPSISSARTRAARRQASFASTKSPRSIKIRPKPGLCNRRRRLCRLVSPLGHLPANFRPPLACQARRCYGRCTAGPATYTPARYHEIDHAKHVRARNP